MIFDTHCHLQFKGFDKNREEVIKRCVENKIYLINVGTNFKTSKEGAELSEKYNFMKASIGLHPLHIKTDLIKQKVDEIEEESLQNEEDFNESEYYKIIENRKNKIVAVGEVGFDLYRKPKTKNKQKQFIELQTKILKKQIRFAKNLNMPIIFHCRMGHKYLIEIIKKEKNIKGTIHSFTGDTQDLKEYLKLGMFIGINALIFKLEWLKDVVKNLPLENMLLETDAPYLAPPSEKFPNEPIFLKHTIKKISEIKKIKEKEIEEITFKNALNLFSISL